MTNQSIVESGYMVLVLGDDCGSTEDNVKIMYAAKILFGAKWTIPGKRTPFIFGGVKFSRVTTHARPRLLTILGTSPCLVVLLCLPYRHSSIFTAITPRDVVDLRTTMILMITVGKKTHHRQTISSNNYK